MIFSPKFLMNLMTLIGSYVIKRKKKVLIVLQSLLHVTICKLVVMSFTLAAITARMLARELVIYFLCGRADHCAGVSFSKS